MFDKYFYMKINFSVFILKVMQSCGAELKFVEYICVCLFDKYFYMKINFSTSILKVMQSCGNELNLTTT